MVIHRNSLKQLCAGCQGFRELESDVGLFLIPAGVRQLLSACSIKLDFDKQ